MTSYNIQNILNEYSLTDLLYNEEALYSSINESFINDLLFDTANEWKETKQLLNKLRIVIPKLIWKITKNGSKIAIKKMKEFVSLINKAKNDGVAREKLIQKLLFGLIAIAITSCGMYQLVDSYNEKPVVEKTKIVYNKDLQTLKIVTPDGKVIDEYKNSDTDTICIQEIPALPVIPNFKQETRVYQLSHQMHDALKEVEDFSAYVYDALHPERKITQADMLNMNLDLTIGYGHKLTKEERKKFTPSTKISVQDANRLFKNDIAKIEEILNKKLDSLKYAGKVIYSQGFIDAVGSLLYNMGQGNMFGNNTKDACEFWQRLEKCRVDENGMNEDDLNYTLSQIPKQNAFLNGHKVRRAAEYKIASQNYGEMDDTLYCLK